MSIRVGSTERGTAELARPTHPRQRPYSARRLLGGRLWNWKSLLRPRVQIHNHPSFAGAG